MYKELLPGLESAMVREFRLSQSLLNLSREERRALLHSDVPRLLVLAEKKEDLLDRLAGLAEVHQQAADLLANYDDALDASGSADSGHLVMHPDAGLRLRHLLEGSRVLASQVRDLAQGNRALAAIALNRASAQQAGLLSDARSDLPALFAALLASREPPNPRDTVGAASPRHDSTLIETMTNLYHQETAYRAVLKVSTRMLAAV